MRPEFSYRTFFIIFRLVKWIIQSKNNWKIKESNLLLSAAATSWPRLCFEKEYILRSWIEFSGSTKMKILLSNQSSSFSQVIQDTKVILEWNTKIGFGIYILWNAWLITLLWVMYIPIENFEKYKTVSVRFTLASKVSKCLACKVSTNLIMSNLFNPKCEIFVINLQNANFFINREFQTTNLQLNDSFLDFITFEIDFIKDPNQALYLPSLDFKIELDLNEN